MKDKLEIELRAKIKPSFKIGFKKPRHVLNQIDTYYFIAKSWVVRIRNSGSKYFLTYKSNKEFGEGMWNEIDIPIGRKTSLMLHKFFLTSGFKIKAQVVKKRQSSKIGDININVDEIKNLGRYIEAEIITTPGKSSKALSKLKDFFYGLGFAEGDLTSKGYVQLLREKHGKN